MFTDEDFKCVTSQPLYRKGKSEILTDSVVSVAYTLSTYKTALGSVVLSSNVQFVIIISTPHA